MESKSSTSLHESCVLPRVIHLSPLTGTLGLAQAHHLSHHWGLPLAHLQLVRLGPFDPTSCLTTLLSHGFHIMYVFKGERIVSFSIPPILVTVCHLCMFIIFLPLLPSLTSCLVYIFSFFTIISFPIKLFVHQSISHLSLASILSCPQKSLMLLFPTLLLFSFPILLPTSKHCT